MMESKSLVTEKYAEFIPTYSAQAIHKALPHLYCCEDLFVKGKLGNGYFASVFLVYHRPTDRLMAMKLTNEASAQRRETELLSSLNHPNVLRFYGSCVMGARLVCLTEYANGGSLAELLAAQTIELPWIVRISLALDILNGLRHIHCHNLIHRDLTSPNILIRVYNRTHRDAVMKSFIHYPSMNSHSLTTLTHDGITDHAWNSMRASNKGEGMCTHCVSLGCNDLLHTERTHQYYSSKTEMIDGLTNSALSICKCDQLSTPDHKQYVNNCLHDEDISLSDLVLLTSPDNLVSLSKPGIPINHLQSIPTIEPKWKQLLLPSNVNSLESRHLNSDSLVYTAVVADLGLCLDLSQENEDPMSLVGNPYYIAPECLNHVAPYTFAADVFSFGLLICELITRLPNDGLLIPRTSSFGLDHQKLPVPATCPSWFYQIALDCCIVDYVKRSSVSELIDRINKFRLSEQCLDSEDELCLLNSVLTTKPINSTNSNLITNGATIMAAATTTMTNE